MEITFADVLKRIEAADDYEIHEIMEAVRKRFSIAFPDWEVIYLSWPKNDPTQRTQALKLLTEYLST